MSFNPQSRAPPSDKSDSQLRKSGRSGGIGGGHQTGVYPGKGGAIAPLHYSSSNNNNPALSNNRSFKKSGNGQGIQNRVASSSSGNSVSAAAPVAPQPVLNGALIQTHSHGPSDMQSATDSGKPAEASTQRSSRGFVPRPPPSQPAVGFSDSATPVTPVKGDASKSFALQFGTISPGMMNGMQIPARTSSAPPNLDEQKMDQAPHGTSRAVPTLPVPSAPKQQEQHNQQQLPKKDATIAQQPFSMDSYRPAQFKQEMQLQMPGGPTAGPPRPTGIPMNVMPMSSPFQQQQTPVQFGNPSPQIQPQGVAPGSLQISMTLPVGSGSQALPHMFVPGIQPQPVNYQGQGLGFAPQMGPQPGIGMPPSQFALQQPGKFGVQRKATTVKITHPDTHEEVRLDKKADTNLDCSSAGQRHMPNLAPQTQPVPFAPYFSQLQPGSYNPSTTFYPPTSHPLANAQISRNSQPPRFSYTVGQGGQTISFMNPSVLSSMPGGKSASSFSSAPESTNTGQGYAPSSSAQVSVKPPLTDKIKTLPVTITAPIAKSVEPKALNVHPEAAGPVEHKATLIDSVPKFASETSVNIHAIAGSSDVQKMEMGLSCPGATGSTGVESVAAVGGSDGRRKESIRRSDSFKDQQKKTSGKDHKHLQEQHQVQVSKPIEDRVSPPLKTSEERTLEDATTREMPESSGKDATNSTSSLQIDSSEPCVLSVTGPSGAVQSEATPLNLGASDDILDKGTEDAVHEGTPDAFEIATTPGALSNDKSVGDIAENETERVAYKNLDSSSSQDAQTLSKVTKEEFAASPCVEHEISDNSLQEGTSSQIHTGSCGFESLNQVAFGMKDNGLDGKQPEFGGHEIVQVNSEVDRKTEVTEQVGAGISQAQLPASTPVEDKRILPDAFGDLKNSVTQLTSMSSTIIQLVDSSATAASEAPNKAEGNASECSNVEQLPVMPSGPKEKYFVEPSSAKPSTKKKRKEMLSKADSAGIYDLYNAYKGPEEKAETSDAGETVGISSVAEAKTITEGDSGKNIASSEEDGQSKAEIDDWEDAVDISTPKLRTMDSVTKVSGSKKHHDEGKNKYSRDFLLKLQEECTLLPIGFQIGPDIANLLMSTSAHFADQPYPSPERISNHSPGVSRGGRRMVGMLDDDKWIKAPGSFVNGQDLQMDLSIGAAGVSLHPGQRVNNGVLRNPRGQSSNQHIGGILSGPMQLLAAQGSVRGGIDADRWLRAPSIQRGLMYSPQSPLQMMHRAESKYEVGKISDEEVAKQRQLKAILNKLTPQNFEKLFQQVKEVNIDNTVTLKGVISQIFDKALMEPTFCEMYASFCYHLSKELPDFAEDNEKITFRRLLLNKCQEEFERGEREEAEANKSEEEGEIKQSDEEREEKRLKARRRMLGNIRLIGELFKKRMLTERIMNECINKLLGQYPNPDEEDIEALCKLMSTIGEMIDQPKAKDHMDAYFDMMQKLSTNHKLSSRVRFMLKDSIDLRKNKWQQRRKVDGPKKIEEVHRDAAQERQAQVGRLSRGSSIGSGSRRAPPIDFGPRGSSVLPSPTSQHMVGGRGLPSAVRGHGTQDVRMEDRPFERTFSIPLPQRPSNDGSITLGPQGGLARGMSSRGQSPVLSAPFAEMPSSRGELHRMESGPNGYTTMQDKLTGISNQPSPQDRGASDRSTTALDSPGRAGVSSDVKSLTEEQLREKSILTIKEFYSAKDEDEVALCVKELNSPSFYPSMISLWVTDSFERKDKERDLLATLLVRLCKSRDHLLSQSQLIQGFESVLSSLEDSVNDAPRAAEFLGRIFARVILEDVLPLREIGRLIHEGGEEPGCLLEIGLASEVLGSTLEVIRTEKGDSVLNEIRTSSDLKLEDFQPPHPLKAKKLEAFL